MIVAPLPFCVKMKNKNRIYLIISIISLTIMVGALGTIGYLLMSYRQSANDYAKLSENAHAAPPVTETVPETSEETEASETESEEEPDVPIPINFDYLLDINQDIIGWITVDGTTIDYPILYDTTPNLYYLNHNFEGTVTGYGSVFITADNTNDFSEFNTVVYGHNMLDGSMFAQLHKFHEQSFLDEHGEIVVYTPDCKRTYQVFAAYRCDNLNIMMHHDYSTEELRQAYLDEIHSRIELARFKEDYPVTPSDSILTLSTCIGNPNYRYIVNSVLVSCERGVYMPPDTNDET